MLNLSPIIVLAIAFAVAVSACSRKEASSAAPATSVPVTPADAATPTATTSPAAAPDGSKAATDPEPSASTAVIPIPVGKTIQKAASLFDLAGKTVRFTPSGDGYVATVRDGVDDGGKGDELVANETSGDAYYKESWRVTLPFAFPFGGTTATEIYANRRGNLSFGKPEHQLYPDRDPWADGGMRSVAAAVDVRSATGVEKMIAALWSTFAFGTKIYLRVDTDAVLFTWNARQEQGLATPTTSTFQAKLFQSGAVELSYPDVQVATGFVGLFPGRGASQSVMLDETNDNIVAGSDDAVNPKALRVYEEGSIFRFELAMTRALAKTVAQGHITYSVSLEVPGVSCPSFGIDIYSDRIAASTCSESPKIIGYEIDGDKLQLRISKLALRGANEVRYWAGITWWDGPPGAFSNIGMAAPHAVPVASLASHYLDLTSPPAARIQGNIFELFHYAQISRNVNDFLKVIYETHQEKEDLAVVMTDFPIDDLFGVAGGSGAMNVAVGGVGASLAAPSLTPAYPTIQGSMAPVYAGSALFREGFTDGYGFTMKNYAPAVALIMHELGHRWGMDLSIVHPKTGERLKLSDGFGHWLERVDTTAVTKVVADYASPVLAERSIMGGSMWVDNGDGTWTSPSAAPSAPGGLGALDLYVMGMLGADELPEMFLLDGLQPLGNGKFTGSKVVFTGADVVAAMGPRTPLAADAQKLFRLRIYLVYEGAAPRPALLERAEKIGAQFRALMSKATGGRMEIR